jgi:hypothetical protein
MYNGGGGEVERLLRELGTDPETGAPSEPDRGEPDRSESDPGEPVWRDIAAVDRSDG